MRGRPDGLSPPPDTGADLEPGAGHRGLGRSRSRWVTRAHLLR